MKGLQRNCLISREDKRGRQTREQDEKRKTCQFDVHPSGFPLLDVDDLFRVLASLAAVATLLLDTPHLFARVTTVARAQDHVAKAEDPLRQGGVRRPVAVASQECQATVPGPGGKVSGGDQGAAGAANLPCGLILDQLWCGVVGDSLGAYELIEKVPMSSSPCGGTSLLPHATAEQCHRVATLVQAFLLEQHRVDCVHQDADID